MRQYKKLSHVIYYHEYHIVWTPKYRFKILEGAIKEFVEDSIRSLCEWKKIEISESYGKNANLNRNFEYYNSVVNNRKTSFCLSFKPLANEMIAAMA